MAKKNERLLGTKMKKLVILLLVFSLLGLTSCGLLEKVGMGKQPTAEELICDIASKSNPTKVATEVTYLTNAGDKLDGYYETVTDGTNAIFSYYYERLATPAESVESGNSDRILSFEGVINFKDGSYFGDEEEWKPGVGTAFDLKFNFDLDLMKDVVVNEDGNALEAKISAEDLPAVLGTDLHAAGDAVITITTNGVNLTAITVTCNTASGTLTIRTSYTYNQQQLFPEPEVEEGVEGEENTENT